MREKSIYSVHSLFSEENMEAIDRLTDAIVKADNIEISEMGALERVLQESQRIDPLVDKVKYMLELLESDLNLLYSERSNSLITLLTIVGLLFALIQIILAIV